MYDDFLLSNKYFRSFCIYRLIFGISYSLMIPILPLFFKHNGMSTVTIGIVISLYGVSKTLNFLLLLDHQLNLLKLYLLNLHLELFPIT